ncbi:hypothetical protein [Burkholderia lata]|uniref:hypothetical protein n=1 Tax=Burkholderia lata (strain ATCC 17760 / DSM 23089 / LMG 22485 / NCIMB 9086 / R18194 / 383) TaxID=482957 RepID=UPI001581BF14|nr:hypothetical protein [Burkholderia lata]
MRIDADCAPIGSREVAGMLDATRSLGDIERAVDAWNVAFASVRRFCFTDRVAGRRNARRR